MVSLVLSLAPNLPPKWIFIWEFIIKGVKELEPQIKTFSVAGRRQQVTLWLNRVIKWCAIKYIKLYNSYNI